MELGYTGDDERQKGDVMGVPGVNSTKRKVQTKSRS